MEDKVTDVKRLIHQNVGREINLKELFEVVKKRFWLVPLTTVLFLMLGLFYSSIPETPLYASSARMIIQTDSLEFLTTLKVLSREPVVMDRIIQELKLDISPGNLRGKLRISSLDGSLITLMTAIDTDPARAASIANAAATAFKQQALASFDFDGIVLLTQAVEEPTPINPPSNRAVYAAIIAGVAIGLLLTFVLDTLDDSIKSARDVEKTLGIPMLGQISKIKKKDWVGKPQRRTEPIARGENIGS